MCDEVCNGVCDEVCDGECDGVKNVPKIHLWCLFDRNHQCG